jgi:lipopolysaccharide/colanic/teichoic acid biosynthesis glycosyltransferase
MTKPTAQTASSFSESKASPAMSAVRRQARAAHLTASRSAAGLRFQLALKVALDRSLAASLLVLTAPVVLASMMLVKLTSRGPALYSQRRVGQFGRVFTIWKLRSMYHNCEKLTGPRWSTPGDPRVTKVGHVLRALHIDELPQLINVLRGQMSLIGPRPERPEIAAKLAGIVNDYNARHAVLPGISGNAQIHLPPDTSVNDVRDKLVLDRDYIARFSAWFDFKMLVFTGLKMIGAYGEKRRG